MRAVLLALTLIPLASAQPANAPTTAHIEGTVRSVTAEPLQYAIVTLMSPTARLACAADQEGKFVIENIAPGSSYQLMSTRSGYIEGYYGSRLPGGRHALLTLSAGQVLRDVVISLAPQGVITGRITDSEGEPVEGAVVLALRPVLGPDGSALIRKESAVTDDGGEYRITEVAPGTYYLRASLRDTGRSEVATYYPNTTELLGAAPIHVFPGAEVPRADIRLNTAQTYSVHGKALIADSGMPAGGFTVSATHNEGSASRQYVTRLDTQTHSDGTFEFAGLPPGQYTLQVTPTRIGAPPVTVSARTDLTIANSNADDVEVILRTGVTVSGKFRLEDGEITSVIPPGSPSRLDTAKDIDTRMKAMDASARGVLIPNNRPSVNLGGSNIGLFQEDGTFSKIVEIPPSRYSLNVALLPEGVYVKSATFGGVDALHAPLDLTQGGGELNLVLSNQAADLAGILHSEKGDALGNVPVTLWPQTADLGSATWGIHYTTTDQNGSFRFSNLPPGRYYVAAWEDVEDSMFVSHEFLSRFDSAATEVKLAESEHARVSPKMIPAESIAAEVAKLQ